MGQPAAKQGDTITASDTHIVVDPAGVPTPVPLPFAGQLDGALSADVRIMGKAAATVGSTATNNPPHLAPPGTVFQSPPGNRATIQAGSQTVRINGKAAARTADRAATCNDPADLPVGEVRAEGTVRMG
jgi:uncharacterized Zn-binding protein involved in type VI secretion